MGSNLRRRYRLREKNFEADYLEIGFSEGTYLKLKIYPSEKYGSSKISVYINRGYEIENIPGRKLESKEIRIASEKCQLCGYLRNPHLFLGKFTGLCALTEDFDECKFPRILNIRTKNDCPIFSEYEKEAIEKENRRLGIRREE